MVSRPAILSAAFAAAGLLAGCGPGGPELHPAGGVVRFADGDPVPGAVVEYLPAGGGPAARGRTDADGHYDLKTGGEPGAVAGKHRVGVAQAVLMDGFGDHVRHMANKQVVPPRFNVPTRSGLTTTVTAGDENDATLTIAPTPPR